MNSESMRPQRPGRWGFPHTGLIDTVCPRQWTRLSSSPSSPSQVTRDRNIKGFTVIHLSLTVNLSSSVRCTNTLQISGTVPHLHFLTFICKSKRPKTLNVASLWCSSVGAIQIQLQCGGAGLCIFLSPQGPELRQACVCLHLRLWTSGSSWLWSGPNLNKWNNDSV